MLKIYDFLQIVGGVVYLFGCVVGKEKNVVRVYKILMGLLK